MENINGNNFVQNKHKTTFSQVLINIIIVILLIMVCLPIVFLIIKSFKDPTQEVNHPFTPTFPLFFENYAIAWEVVKYYFVNTLIVAFVQTFGVLLVCSVASYGFMRYNFPFKKVIFIGILSLMMVPGILTLIPQVQLVLNVFHLKNTYIGVVLPSITGALPMGIFLLNTFFSGLPKDLFEAAELDGASNLRQYFFIAIPLSIPILATLGLMQFIGAWNDLLWPQLILQDESMHTISVGLVPFTESFYALVGSFGVPFAGYVIVSLPLIIIFFFTSKQFIRGLTSGAFKM